MFEKRIQEIKSHISKMEKDVFVGDEFWDSIINDMKYMVEILDSETDFYKKGFADGLERAKEIIMEDFK